MATLPACSEPGQRRPPRRRPRPRPLRPTARSAAAAASLSVLFLIVLLDVAVAFKLPSLPSGRGRTQCSSSRDNSQAGGGGGGGSGQKGKGNNAAAEEWLRRIKAEEQLRSFQRATTRRVPPSSPPPSSSSSWLSSSSSSSSSRGYSSSSSSSSSYGASTARRLGAKKQKSKEMGDHDKAVLERLRRRREGIGPPPPAAAAAAAAAAASASRHRVRHRRRKTEEDSAALAGSDGYDDEEEGGGGGMTAATAASVRATMKRRRSSSSSRLEDEGDGGAAGQEVDASSVPREGRRVAAPPKKGLWVDEAGAARIGTRALREGDYLVHEDYGFARFDSLAYSRAMSVAAPTTAPGGQRGTARRVVRLVFGNTRGEGKKVELSELSWPLLSFHAPRGTRGVVLGRYTDTGKAAWQKKRQKARVAAEEAAAELVALYAEREATQRPPCAPDDPALVAQEVDAGFGFELTEGQRAALADVERDMVWRARPMDRLVLGDVGFGKTEVAVRAVHRAVANGRQAAVLAPTTILAAQHYARLCVRFPGMRIAMLRGSDTVAAAKAVRAGLKDGSIQVVVGTTAITGRQVQFDRLGLVVVDEEQRLGVGQKEKLKALAKGVDVLTLSATPIPRTLQMALSGMREVSHIHTAPSTRLPVATAILPWEPAEVAEALKRELARGGQAFYVVPRIRDIPLHVQMLQELLKGSRRDGGDPRIVVAHGALPAGEAEDVLVKFAMREGDVLVATTLIENGLDVPTVNTVVVAQAHKLGLASLYQLRGRVGRAEKQAYAYFFHPRQQQKDGEGKEGRMKGGSSSSSSRSSRAPASARSKWDDEDEDEEGDEDANDNSDLLATQTLSRDREIRARQLVLLGGKSMTHEAVQRLAALKEYSHLLGMGPQLAKADLAIRGAGEILGYEQSGDKGSGVGYEAYMDMLAEALVKVRGTAIEPTPYTDIDLGDGLGNDRVISPDALVGLISDDDYEDARAVRKEEVEAARLAPTFDALKAIAQRWRVEHGQGRALPKAARRLFMRLSLLLACRTLSGEQLKVLRSPPPSSSSSERGGADEKAAASSGKARVVLATKRLELMHWEALQNLRREAKHAPPLRHPNLRKPAYFRDRARSRRRGPEQQQQQQQHEEGEEEGQGEEADASATDTEDEEGGGRGGYIVMDIRDERLAVETALAVLMPLAELVLEQRQSLAERIGQGGRRGGGGKAG